MQLDFNPLNNSYGSKPYTQVPWANPFNPLNYNAINQQAQQPAQPPMSDPLTTSIITKPYTQVPWANPLQQNNVQIPFNSNVNPATTQPQEQAEETNEGEDFTASADMGMENKFMGVGGAALGVYNAIQGNKAQQEELRRREIEVEQAIGQNASEREKIELMNPNANMRAKMAMMQSGKSAAMQQAANVGGANVTSSGLGGDVGSAKIAAMKASGPMAQAGSAYDMQMAGAIDQRAGEENQQIQQLSNNTMQRGQLSQMTDYIEQEKNKNPLDGILSAALSGATGGNIMGTMLGGEGNLASLGKKKIQTNLTK